MQVQNKVESYFVIFGTKLSIPEQTLRAMYLCMHLCALNWPVHLPLLTKIVFLLKGKNLKLALPVMHLPYSSLIFSLKGALKFFVVNSAFIRFIKSKGNKKDSIAVLNASFLLSTYFIIL